MQQTLWIPIWIDIFIEIFRINFVWLFYLAFLQLNWLFQRNNHLFMWIFIIKIKLYHYFMFKIVIFFYRRSFRAKHWGLVIVNLPWIRREILFVVSKAWHRIWIIFVWIEQTLDQIIRISTNVEFVETDYFSTNI